MLRCIFSWWSFQSCLLPICVCFGGPSTYSRVHLQISFTTSLIQWAPVAAQTDQDVQTELAWWILVTGCLRSNPPLCTYWLNLNCYQAPTAPPTPYPGYPGFPFIDFPALSASWLLGSLQSFCLLITLLLFVRAFVLFFFLKVFCWKFHCLNS